MKIVNEAQDKHEYLFIKQICKSFLFQKNKLHGMYDLSKANNMQTYPKHKKSL